MSDLPQGIRIRNGKPQAWFRDGDGHQHAQSFDTVEEAVAWRTVQLADVARGNYFDLNRGRTTVEAGVLEWLPLLKGRPQSIERIKRCFFNQILPALGQESHTGLSPKKAMAFAKSIEDLKPAGQGLVIRQLLRYLDYAVQEKLLHHDQLVGIKRVLKDNSETDNDEALYRPLEPDEVMVLVEAMFDYMQVTIKVGAWTGLRAGETLGLTVDKVNFLRHRIHVHRQLKLAGDGRLYLGPLKNKWSRRDLDVDPMVTEAIAAHLAAFPARETEVWVTDDDKRFRTERHQFIVLGQRGAPFRPHDIGTLVRRTAAAAGIDRRIVFHSLRHHFASLALTQGWPITELSRYLGHANPAITLRVYSHFMAPTAPRRLITEGYSELVNKRGVDQVLTENI